ncbi:hypothetical protein HK099_007843 [Clydaea vesicula]|uniref:PB1 domain-containing protein n=1 Tax=Clydaea vesicula TaxID=447962 RepID=A0AAD5U853_9FUNG|nr:hypothetical protein HK099_007843 [Clydaea vesicula]
MIFLKATYVESNLTEVRRVPLVNQELTIDELHIMLKRLFKTKNFDNTIFKYKDHDDDLIVLENDDDKLNSIKSTIKDLDLKIDLILKEVNDAEGGNTVTKAGSLKSPVKSLSVSDMAEFELKTTGSTNQQLQQAPAVNAPQVHANHRGGQQNIVQPPPPPLQQSHLSQPQYNPSFTGQQQPNPSYSGPHSQASQQAPNYPTHSSQGYAGPPPTSNLSTASQASQSINYSGNAQTPQSYAAKQSAPPSGYSQPQNYQGPAAYATSQSSQQSSNYPTSNPPYQNAPTAQQNYQQNPTHPQSQQFNSNVPPNQYNQAQQQPYSTGYPGYQHR